MPPISSWLVAHDGARSFVTDQGADGSAQKKEKEEPPQELCLPIQSEQR